MTPPLTPPQNPTPPTGGSPVLNEGAGLGERQARLENTVYVVIIALFALVILAVIGYIQFVLVDTGDKMSRIDGFILQAQEQKFKMDSLQKDLEQKNNLLEEIRECQKKPSRITYYNGC